MKKHINKFLDIIADGIMMFVAAITEIVMPCLVYLLTFLLIVLTPVWIIPYIIFRKKP